MKKKKILHSKSQALAYLLNCIISLLGNDSFSVASYCSYQNTNKTSRKPGELGEILTSKGIHFLCCDRALDNNN